MKEAAISSSHPKPRLSKAPGLISSLVRPHRFPLAVSLLLIIVERFCSFAVPISSRYLINDVMYQHKVKDLPTIIGAVIIATSLGALITYVLDRYLAVTGQRLVTELRTQVQEHIGRLPISFYDKNRTGALVARIMTDVESMRNLIGAGLLDFLGGIFTAVIALGILMRISLLMTALTVCIIIALGWFLKRAFGITRPLFRERSRINAEVTGRLTESLGGIRVVKGYHAEASEARIFSEGAHRLLENITLSINAQAFMSLCMTMVLGVVAALIMYLGANEVGSNHLDVGSYVEFTMLLAFMVAPIVMSVNIGTQLTEAFAGLDRTLEILKEAEEDSESKRTHVMESVIGHIAFRNVTFSYLPGKTVLHGLSFDSPPGTVTALVGSSGSGKSTVISLICGFHNANGGQVSVDNVDLSTIRLGRFREQLGVVLQETFLFDGTIRDNVLFSRPGATPAQLLEACRIARVDEFAESFPDQYETIVGERGVKLSGGQRQRISIARAILADPRILILDEATSSLDSESEALIQSGLKYLMQGRTTFVIAHRLSTIRRADQILVLEKGRIVERGTHESLYRDEGRYYEFYTQQHGVEANLFLAPGEGDKIM
jgi:ABC-type multidrug transport system fused ATPase/permease subunit